MFMLCFCSLSVYGMTDMPLKSAEELFAATKIVCSGISEEISKFASQHGIDERSKMIVSLASEEIVYNIIKFGYKNNVKSYIDVSLKKIDNTLILKISDDGLPFDPTVYELDNNDEEFLTDGIDVIKKLADKLQYIRVLNLNNTVFELNISK